MAETKKKPTGKTKAQTERAKSRRNTTTGADEGKIKRAGKSAVESRQKPRLTDAQKVKQGAEALKSKTPGIMSNLRDVEDYYDREGTARLRERQAEIIKNFDSPTSRAGRMAGRLASIAARKANIIAGAVATGLTTAGVLSQLDGDEDQQFDTQYMNSLEGGIPPPSAMKNVEDSFGPRDSFGGGEPPVEDRKQHLLQSIGNKAGMGENAPALGAPFRPEPGINTSQPPTRDTAPQAEKPLSESSFVRNVQTKGGNYPIFKSGSSEANDFRTAFDTARRSGQSIFSWQGRQYNTRMK